MSWPGGLPIIVYADLARPLAPGETFDADAYRQAFEAGMHRVIN